MPEVLITRAQAAAQTGLSVVTIDKLIAQGKLPSVKIGHARRLPIEAVTAFIASANRATRERAADATERKIAQLLEQAPPLTDEQRSRLRSLLTMPVQAGETGATR